jgi:GT2 family glycosyltransferase
MAREGLIGVVTVTYNSASVLLDFLRCMVEQTHQNFFLFTVDNASKDGTLRILHKCTDGRLRIIANPDNRGVAEGNNQGISAAIEAGCSSILLINNDTEFDATLIAQLNAGLDSHHVEMTCPKIMYYDEPNRIWAAGGAFQPWLGYRCIHFGENEIDGGQYNRASLVSYVPTCCVLIRKEVFEKVGLMDERYFVYSDDADFMYRAMKANVKLMYLPDAKLMHKVGILTGGETSAFSIRYGTRNRIFFLLKHFGLLLTLPWLVICQVQFFARFLVKRKGLPWLLLKEGALWGAIRMYIEHRNQRRGSGSVL